MQRIAHFYIEIKHIAGKHQPITEYLSRDPVSKPERMKFYSEENVINCVIPLIEFIIKLNKQGSINDSTGQKYGRTFQKSVNTKQLIRKSLPKQTDVKMKHIVGSQFVGITLKCSSKRHQSQTTEMRNRNGYQKNRTIGERISIRRLTPNF